MAMTRTWAVVLAAGVSAAGCTQALKLMKDDSATILSKHTIDLPNPASPGSFAVKTLFYGSGTDQQRPEYGDQVAIKTKTVDVSPFASVPPAQAKTRSRFWGFDLKKAPINGRVWYPDEAGPFPLVLIVHGNHNWREFSDSGYGYLGELLASRGFILASVDENFINGLSAENDGRAWLLLKHLEAWKSFNETPGGPFDGRVDMSRIALIGHSRGGEAAALAATFNRLKFYPDNFKQAFNFNFDIKAVVAIAPVDGQYKPTGQFTPLENVDYLLIHGSHDGDVSSALGLRQYERLRFTDGMPHFKAVVFMYRANHGQWNTVWGNKDTGPRSGRTLDLRALIDPEAQRQFARVVISGFLEASLHGERGYVPMFRDHRSAGGWLPKTMYTTRFEDSGYRGLAEFDGDIDLTTGSAPGVTLSGEHLSAWHEAALPFRGRGNDTQNHNAVWIGWNNRLAGRGGGPGRGASSATETSAPAAADPNTPAPDDSGPLGPPATYSITVPEPLRVEWNVTERSAIYLSVAATNTTPGPRAPDKDAKGSEGDEDVKAAAGTGRARPQQPPARPKAPPKPKEPDQTPVDFTVELVDAQGHVARLPLSRYGIARRPLDTRIFRRAGRDAARFSTTYELVPQTFVLPLEDFVAAQTSFDPRQLATIRLVFDRTVAGTVVLQQVGVSTPPDPVFLASPVR